MRPVLHVLALLLLSTIQIPVNGQPFDMGPLNPFLKEEADRVWTIRNQGGAVSMENQSTPGHLNYYHAAPVPGTEGRRTSRLRSPFQFGARVARRNTVWIPGATQDLLHVHRRRRPQHQPSSDDQREA